MGGHRKRKELLTAYAVMNPKNLTDSGRLGWGEISKKRWDQVKIVPFPRVRCSRPSSEPAGSVLAWMFTGNSRLQRLLGIPVRGDRGLAHET